MPLRRGRRWPLARGERRRTGAALAARGGLGRRAGLACPASFGLRPLVCFPRSIRGMRACIYANAGGCGLVTAVGAAVRSRRLTHRGRALREVACPRVPFMAGVPLLARGFVDVRH